jgi:hypothetical protein
MDSVSLKNHTKTIVDNLNRFLDIKYITKETRRKYIKLIKDFFNESEFSNDVSSSEQEITGNISKSFEEVLDEINVHYHQETSKYSIDNYREILLVEANFLKVVDVIKEEIKFNIHNKRSSGKLIDEIDSIISATKKT